MTDHLREEILSSEVVFRGFLTLRVDQVRLPDGMLSVREVVVHPGAVAMVPLLDADHVLLVRQWRNAVGCALLELPAGALSPGENPRDCAARELMEEIGYRPGTLTPLCTTFLAPGYSSEKLHLFLAENLQPERLPHDEDERLETVPMHWDEINDLLRRGELSDSKTLSGLLLARQVLAQRDAAR